MPDLDLTGNATSLMGAWQASPRTPERAHVGCRAMTSAQGPSFAARSSAAGDGPLTVRSEQIDLTGGLLGRLPSSDGALAWVRDGHGLVGWGEVARLEVRGPDRFALAQAWWRDQVARFDVEDDVRVSGSGPLAFGSFTFNDDSEESSVLVVPAVVLGRRDGVAWLTTIGTPPRLSSPQPLSAPGWLSYSSGQTSVTEFRAAVTEAVAQIAAGALAKVVLAHDLLATDEAPIDVRYLLAGLADRYPDCWTFSIEGLVGATPELLVSLHDSEVTALVLAGTIARGGDADDDRHRHEALLASAKDQEEHRYAAESLVTSLAPHCASLADTSAPYLLDLSNVAHLATDVRGTVSPGNDVLDLVRAVHPPAAVGGTPTPTAVAMIRALESMDRGRYAGPVGWVDAAGDGEWGIALRCAQVNGRVARLFAGCGIVADSDPDEEMAEAQAKFVPMRDALEGVRS
jgi:menaquinone-specific isochorismate synthase